MPQCAIGWSRFRDADRDWKDLSDLFKRFSTTLSNGENDLGRMNAMRNRFDIGSMRPFLYVLSRHQAVMVEAIDAHVDVILKANLIKPAQSKWASNMVMVRKSDGNLGFCHDYRQMNERTLKNSFPLPRMDVYLDALAGSTWYSTLDVGSGYMRRRWITKISTRRRLLPDREPFGSK